MKKGNSSGIQNSVVRSDAEVLEHALRSPLHASRSTCLKSAFTLVELLVVMVIISILAGITLPLSRYAIRRANEARQKVMRSKIHSALEEYRGVYGEYPITPPADPADVIRHYPATYETGDTISDSQIVNLSGTNTIETIYIVNPEDGTKTKVGAKIDYCLTYPLMLKQMEKGSRPFMEFPIVDVLYLVVDSTDIGTGTRWRQSKIGEWVPYVVEYIYGHAVKRPRAVDPVLGVEWKYVCTNGLSYQLIP